MNKRQVLDDVLAGRPTVSVPTLFWKHFAADDALGDAAVRAHRDWVTATDPVLIKVMNEQLYPVAPDWESVATYRVDEPRFQGQLQVVRALVEEYGESHQVFVTMHGVVISAFHSTGVPGYEPNRMLVSKALREQTEAVDAAYQTVAESLIAHAEAYLDAGADGITYAALGGERSNFTADEFARHVRPRDLAVLEAIGDAGGTRMLHLCKDDLDIDRFRGYPAEMVSWGARLNDISFERARSLFPDATLVGGIASDDPLFARGPHAGHDSIATIARVVAENGGQERLIVSADCSLPDQTAGRDVGVVAAAAARA